MNIEESLKSALISLKANKVRSMLTMLGIVIGVFSVVSLVSVGIGIKNYVTDQFEGLGSNLIIIAPGVVDFSDDPAKAFTRNKLAEKHLELIETYAGEYIIAATPSIRIGEVVNYKTNSFDATVIGANYRSNDIINYIVESGRNFSKSEQNGNAKVALIGYEVQQELFTLEDPKGKQIEIGSANYEVIGVLKEQGNAFDDRIIVPYTTLMTNMDLQAFSNIAVKGKDSNKIDQTMRAIELALLRDLEEDDFSILSQSDILGSIQSILGILTLGISAIAGISLLVGGIGIMNIMLVSVTERIKEIGLRKAVGATAVNIASQFLIEAVILSVLGGLIGILLGWLMSLVLSKFVNTAVPINTVLLAFGFSLLVGVVFGTYPAISASKKDPIASLTFE